MDCELASRHLGPYLDGELSAQQTLELERHLQACAECAAGRDFGARLKASVRAQLAPEAAPAALRQRVQDGLASAQTRHGGGIDRGLSAGLLAVAAVVLIGVFGGNDLGRQAARFPESQATAGFEGVQQVGLAAGPALFHEVVSGHTDQLPAEVQSSEPERVSGWFSGKLGFRVPPVRFRSQEVQLLGARVSNVGSQRAARLYYSVGGKRLTALAFEATPGVRRMLEASDTLQRVHVGQREISYHTIHGYTVPVVESGGVVYAFTGDMDQPSLLRLVASAQMP